MYEIPKEVLLVGVSALYAWALSSAWGRKLDGERVLRPLVVAVGVAIVLAVWSQGDAATFWYWMSGFVLAGIPQWLGVAITHIKERDEDKVTRHSVEAVNRAEEA